MRPYIKGNYETSIFQTCMNNPWKMWFKERKGVKIVFMHVMISIFSVSLINFLRTMSVGERLILCKATTLLGDFLSVKR